MSFVPVAFATQFKKGYGAMAILKEAFAGVKVGQVWQRRNPRCATSPDILVLAINTSQGTITARTYDGENNVVGSTTVYPYLENIESGYEYLGVLKPEPEAGAVLKRHGSKGYLKVLKAGELSCKIADWDKRSRAFLSESRTLKLDASFWESVDIFWPRKKKLKK
jgi:hypothetical protein